MEAETTAGWFSGAAATFGDRLEGAREAAGMTQEALARRLGVRLTTLQAWEGDAADPRANRLQMLAGMLNVSLMWLLTGEGDGIDGPKPAPTEMSLAAVLAEVRALRAGLSGLDGRLERLEKRLTTQGGV
ncbi:helix-turn-helix domain-containing protein [Phaeovulum sp.]|uniref:helix-turn-helix domain-containing protein n=1 Tax=Phaeovulum sp. TaxID=2934796 RepID=UPI0039E27762